MADNKKSFLLYADLIHTVRKMPEEKAGKLFLTILEYVNDQDPNVEDDFMVDLVFEPIKQQMKRDSSKWVETKDLRSNSGNLGNLKRWNEDLYLKVKNEEISLEEALIIAINRKASPSDSLGEKPSQNVANVAVNVNATVNVNDIKKNITGASQPVDINKSKEVFNSGKSFFIEMYKTEFGTVYYFEPKDAAKIKSIVKKVHFKMQEKDGRSDFTIKELSEATQFFMQATLKTADPWLKSNFSLSNIDSKFNEIYSSIKNPSNGISKTKPKSIFADN